MPRPKFYRNYGPLCQLRAEQIGPHLWHASVYEKYPAGDDVWHRSTALSEIGAKNDALSTAKGRLLDRGERGVSGGDWTDDSQQPDHEWKAELERLHFPGYLERNGMPRFEDI